MRKPEGVSDAAWGEAAQKASRDRLRLANLVARGLVMRRRGEPALALPPRVNTAVRPNRKRKGKR